MEDYRASHTAPDKGATYAAGFEKKNNFGFVWEWEQQALAQIMDELGYQASERHGAYLDFACGTGRIIGHLAGRFEQATGVDVSESMLEQARHNAEGAELILGDLTSEPVVGDRRFDVITAFRFFVNAQDALRESAMGAIAGHLAEDGYFVFNNHVNRNSLFSRVVLLTKWLRGDRSGTFRTMSLGETRALLKRHGLEVVKTRHRGVIPVFNDESERVPFGLLRPLENLFSKLGIFRPVSRYVIFVCRRATSANA